MPTNISNQSSQTIKLLRAYHRSQSLTSQVQLKAKIIQLNSDLIQQVLKTSHRRQDNSQEDFLQAGLQGLAHAVETFDPDHCKQPFRAFATPYIHQYVQNYAGQILEQALDEQVKTHPHKVLSDDTPSGILKAQTLVVFELYRQEPTPALLDRLVKLNIGLVKKEAHHWSHQCTENYDDLLQVGSMGLLRAIDRFDLDKGYAFSTFAVPYIRGEIQHYLRDKSPTLKMPRQWLAMYNQGCKAVQTLRLKLNRDATDQEIAEVLSITISEWQQIKLACKNRSPLSLDAPVNEEEDGFTSLGELVQDHQYRSFQLAQEDSIRLHQAMAHLEDRTREVVEFVFIKEFTHREVAEILGISAVTVSRQVKKGVTLLKQIMTAPLD